MASTWKSRTRLLAIAVGLLLVGSLVWAAQPSERLRDRLVRDFVAEANRAGSPVRADEVLTIVRKSATFITSPLRGYERIPATELARGADFAFAFVDAPKSGIPEGHYKLRAFAPNVRLGEIRGRVEFVNANGIVVKRVPATLRVKSLRVPSPLPFPHTRILGGIQNAGANVIEPDQATDIYVWVLCPNGAWICYVVRIEDVPVDQ